jgi:hypothetical protein
MKTTPLLCANTKCASRGRHKPDCANIDTCWGCLPRLAADGIYLCDLHDRKIAEDALTTALRHTDLGRVLTGSSSSLGDVVSGTRKNPGLNLNDRAAEMRAVIKHRLVAIVKMISEERGLPLPEDRVPALARYVAKHSRWLAAHAIAGEISEELADTASEAFHIAHPTGARKYQLKDPDGNPVGCRETVDGGESCPGSLWTVLRRVDSLLPSELVCDHDNEHFVPADKWMTFGRQWVKERVEGAA